MPQHIHDLRMAVRTVQTVSDPSVERWWRVGAAVQLQRALDRGLVDEDNVGTASRSGRRTSGPSCDRSRTTGKEPVR